MCYWENGADTCAQYKISTKLKFVKKKKNETENTILTKYSKRRQK